MFERKDHLRRCKVIAPITRPPSGMGGVLSVESEIGDKVRTRQNAKTVVGPDGEQPLVVPGIYVVHTGVG